MLTEKALGLLACVNQKRYYKTGDKREINKNTLKEKSTCFCLGMRKSVSKQSCYQNYSCTPCTQGCDSVPT